MRTLAPVMAFALLLGTMAAVLADASDLFQQQLDNPKTRTNVGVQYWIELRRGAKTIKTNHKMVFKSGDSIRFHVKPNIDGYAYILLTSGSDGQKAQLFPSENTEKDNRIYRGKDIVLPPPGALLKFDSTPGTEKLSLIISREKIDPQTYLRPKKKKPVNTEQQKNSQDDSSESTPTIAMNTAGTRDLFPENTSVAYVTPSDLSPPVRPKKSAPATSKPETTANAQSQTKTEVTKVTKVSTVAAKTDAQTPKPPAVKVALKPASTKQGNVTEDAQTPKPPVAKVALNPASTKQGNLTEEMQGIVTVVYRKPNGVLCCEIALKHI